MRQMGFILKSTAFALTAIVSNAALAAGDPVAGKTIFARCGVCHSTDPGTNRIGPSLANIVGRKSASIATFAYSPAMKAANLVWTPAVLDKYLTNPRAMVPGTKMFFAGLPNAPDRANVIAYLQKPDAAKK